MSRFMRLLAVVLVLTVFALSMASCAGKFALTHKLLNWNLSLNKWLGSFVMFVFIILPVYGISALIDWVILNVIEFYGGSNPVGSTATPQTQTARIDGRQISMTQYPGEGINLDLTTVEADGSVRVMLVRTTEDGVTARVQEGNEESLITARLDADGRIERCMADGCRAIGPEEQSEVIGWFDGLNKLLVEENQ